MSSSNFCDKNPTLTEWGNLNDMSLILDSLFTPQIFTINPSQWVSKPSQLYVMLGLETFLWLPIPLWHLLNYLLLVSSFYRQSVVVSFFQCECESKLDIIYLFQQITLRKLTFTRTERWPCDIIQVGQDELVRKIGYHQDCDELKREPTKKT